MSDERTTDDVKAGRVADVVLDHTAPPVIVPAMLRVNCYTLAQHQAWLAFLGAKLLTEAEIARIYPTHSALTDQPSQV